MFGFEAEFHEFNVADHRRRACRIQNEAEASPRRSVDLL
jgi:hypothetical protein